MGIELHQYCDLRDIEDFARLAHEHFKRHHEQSIAGVPARGRNVAELFAPPHEMHVHWAVIILVCIRLEENVKAISALIYANDDLPKSIQDFKTGSLIERFRRFLTESAGWNAKGPKNSTWEDVSGVYAIRNCLIHSQANFQEFELRYPKRANQIRKFSLRHGTPGFVDAWLNVDLETALLCAESVKQFFEGLFQELKKRPDYLVTKEPGE